MEDKVFERFLKGMNITNLEDYDMSFDLCEWSPIKINNEKYNLFNSDFVVKVLPPLTIDIEKTTLNPLPDSVTLGDLLQLEFNTFDRIGVPTSFDQVQLINVKNNGQQIKHFIRKRNNGFIISIWAVDPHQMNIEVYINNVPLFPSPKCIDVKTDMIYEFINNDK